jgi:maltokinase
VPRLDDLAEKLAPLLGQFLPRQRWYAGHETPSSVAVAPLDLRDGEPALAWFLLDVTDADGAVATYQVVLGGRPARGDDDFLLGKELEKVAPDESATIARPLVVDQSNSSVVYDERLILKLFRRVHPEPNPDVEITEILGERGFPHVVPQLATLRSDRADLAVVRQYLLGSTDAWNLAHTSLRDLLGTRMPPEEAGGDFGPEAFALGEVTGRLHVALSEAFGTDSPDPAAWLDAFRAQLSRVPKLEWRGAEGAAGDEEAAAESEPSEVTEVVDVAAAEALLAELVDVDDAGRAFRIHGDLHLGQFLLGDAGWFVLDFEGEPVRPVVERQAAASPLRDVAGIIRSFHYAARTGLAERGRDVDDELVDLADAWEVRAVEAYLAGYHHVEGVEELLPANDADRDKVLRAFELDKAIYEVIYELAHRPDWVAIPASAVRRTLALAAG